MKCTFSAPFGIVISKHLDCTPAAKRIFSSDFLAYATTRLHRRNEWIRRKGHMRRNHWKSSTLNKTKRNPNHGHVQCSWHTYTDSWLWPHFTQHKCGGSLFMIDKQPTTGHCLCLWKSFLAGVDSEEYECEYTYGFLRLLMLFSFSNSLWSFSLICSFRVVPVLISATTYTHLI